MTRRPDISIVVCTRNRAPYLTQTLRFYEQVVSKPNWELIVVDNGSSDETPEVLDRFASATRVAIRRLAEPRTGASRARNLGWQHAEGEIIAFTDDDCYPQADYVDALWVNFASNAVGYLGGRVLLFTRDDYPITIQPREERLVFPPGSFISTGVIQGANIAVRKDVLTALGGFDDLLGAGTRFPCEDVDLLSRASFAGIAGVYDPRPVIFHHHRRQSREQVQALARYYDRGRGAYYAKALLTPGQRSKAARSWCRRTGRELINKFRVQGNGLISFRELQGAIEYCWMRARAGVTSE